MPSGEQEEVEEDALEIQQLLEFLQARRGNFDAEFTPVREPAPLDVAYLQTLSPHDVWKARRNYQSRLRRFRKPEAVQRQQAWDALRRRMTKATTKWEVQVGDSTSAWGGETHRETEGLGGRAGQRRNPTTGKD